MREDPPFHRRLVGHTSFRCQLNPCLRERSEVPRRIALQRCISQFVWLLQGPSPGLGGLYGNRKWPWQLLNSPGADQPREPPDLFCPVPRVTTDSPIVVHVMLRVIGRMAALGVVLCPERGLISSRMV